MARANCGLYRPTVHTFTSGNRCAKEVAFVVDWLTRVNSWRVRQKRISGKRVYTFRPATRTREFRVCGQSVGLSHGRRILEVQVGIEQVAGALARTWG